MQSLDIESHPDAHAWYRQFWVWIAILLPSSVVVAGFVTLWLALSYPDREIAGDEIREPVNTVLGRNSVAPPKR